MIGRKFNQEKPSLKLIFKVGSNPSTPELSSNICGDGGSEKKSRKKRKINDKTDSDEDSQVDDYNDEDAANKTRVHREKRNVNIEERTPLQMCLDHLLKLLQRKDPNGFFAFPVTDLIAPGYSKVISKAMDFSTMKKKINQGDYQSVKEFRDDFKLMMENCMNYNQPDTIYHKEGKKLLPVGLKYLGKERLNQMRRTYAFMSNLTKEEIGFGDEAVEVDKENSNSKYLELDKALDLNEDNNYNNAEIGKFEAIPDALTPSEILEQVQAAAALAADKLQTAAPKSKMGYLKSTPDGTTVLNILNPDNKGIISERERVVDLGGLVGRLVTGQDHLNMPKEDIRNKINPVTYLNYGAFGSYGPVYDTTNANTDKETTNLLLTTYADETGVQYAKSLKEFVSGCGEYAISMVDNLLDVLTNGEHMKTEMYLKEQELLKQQQRQQISNSNTTNNNNSAVTQATANNISMETITPQLNNNHHDDTLQKTSNLLLTLEQTQRSRLSQDHLKRFDALYKPNNNEVNLAQNVTSELVGLIQHVTPKDIVDIDSLRKSMGFSNELLNIDLQQQLLPTDQQQLNVEISSVDDNIQQTGNDTCPLPQQPTTTTTQQIVLPQQQLPTNNNIFDNINNNNVTIQNNFNMQQ